jgi:hypothetical protein
MPRHPEISRAAFRAHYEDRHVPLALAYFPFAKYVRNHVYRSCLSEFWVDDVGEIHALMVSGIGDIMREDERRFTDQPRIGPAIAEEIYIAGPVRGVEEGPVAKEALLLTRSPPLTGPEFLATLQSWAMSLASPDRGLLRITLDIVTPFENRDFPRCDAILYGWIAEHTGVLFDAVPPDGVGIHARLVLEAIESRMA